MSAEQDYKYKDSKLINDRLDVKAATVHTLYAALNVINEGNIEGIEASGKMELVYITNLGYITGDIVNIEEAANIENATKDFSSYLFSSSVKHRNSYIAESEESNENLSLINDTSIIYLKNVVLRPFSAPDNAATIGDMLLFTDHILGVTAKQVTE